MARREATESRLLVSSALDLARSLGITKLLVQADDQIDMELVADLRKEESVIWMMRSDPDAEPLADPEPPAANASDAVVNIPDVDLTRMSQINIALFWAVLGGNIALEESVMCLSGVAGSGRLDMLLIANPKRDFPWFKRHDVESTRELINTRELARLIDIALRFAAEGREGRAIGTAFVLGDLDQLQPHLKQLVLNPCAGHPKKSRSIHDTEFVETLREFAAMDGAFIVSNRGVVESAGTYLGAATRRTRVRGGLGARHTAAAAITAETDAVAVVVSSSSSNVTVFHQGIAILELERPEQGSDRTLTRKSKS